MTNVYVCRTDLDLAVGAEVTPPNNSGPTGAIGNIFLGSVDLVALGASNRVCPLMMTLSNLLTVVGIGRTVLLLFQSESRAILVQHRIYGDCR